VFNRLNDWVSKPQTKKAPGLGLHWLKRLAERMKGYVGFDSGPEFGTTFWVNMPISPQNRMDLEFEED
jgi:signal transduction histidine kinase